MRREHHESRIVKINQRHQHKIDSIGLVHLSPRGSYFLAIVQCCLITMMPIRDIQLTLGKEIVDQGNLPWISNWLEAVSFLCLVYNLYLRLCRILSEQTAHTALWVIIHTHN